MHFPVQPPLDISKLKPMFGILRWLYLSITSRTTPSQGRVVDPVCTWFDKVQICAIGHNPPSGRFEC